MRSHLILVLCLLISYAAPAQTAQPSGQTRTQYNQQQKKKKKVIPREAQVLICQSRSAYAYHSYECRGLNRCRSEVSRVSVSEARNFGYVPCKICY